MYYLLFFGRLLSVIFIIVSILFSFRRNSVLPLNNHSSVILYALIIIASQLLPKDVKVGLFNEHIAILNI